MTNRESVRRSLTRCGKTGRNLTSFGGAETCLLSTFRWPGYVPDSGQTVVYKTEPHPNSDPYILEGARDR